MCQWPCTASLVVPCDSEWHVECLSLPTHVFHSFFLSHLALCQLQRLLSCRVQYPCNFLFLICLSLLMLHPIIGPFIYRALWFPSSGVAPGLVLCGRCILPCKNSRPWHSCCIKWPFGYPVRWLSYIWKIAHNHIYLINVVPLLFFFPD